MSALRQHDIQTVLEITSMSIVDSSLSSKKVFNRYILPPVFGTFRGLLATNTEVPLDFPMPSSTHKLVFILVANLRFKMNRRRQRTL